MQRQSILAAAILFAAASPAAHAIIGTPTSVSINFANLSATPANDNNPQDAGFPSVYNPSGSPNPSNSNPVGATGFFVGPNPNPSYGTNNMLNIWTDPGDIYGDYEDQTNSAKNVFYSSLATGSETIVTANVIVQNLNNNYHGGGIWLGTDENHYIRLGVIYNGGNANIEMLRENEDLWTPPGNPANTGTNGLSGDGNDIADQQEQTSDTPIPNSNPQALEALSVELQLILTGSTARAQYSLDGGSTWSPVNANVPYFAGIATSPADGATVQGGFKVGVFGFGGGAGVGSPPVTDEALVSFTSFNANTYTLPNVEWNTGSGNASNTANFSNLTTTANYGNEGRVYEFGTVAGQSGVTTVTLDSALNGTLDVGGLVFSNPNGYTIAGPNGLVVNGGLIDSRAGVNTISAPMTVSGFARVDSQIHVASGSKLVLAGATVPRLNSLVIDSGGTLDLKTNSIELDYETAATDPYSTIVSYLRSGVTSGTGLISTSHVTGTALGIIDTGVTSWGTDQMFGPHYVGSNALMAADTDPRDSSQATNRDVLIMYTWLGDTNLDGKVNSADLANMAPIGTTNATWATGDFNYDGIVNADDLSLFELGDASQNAVLAPAPEPAGLLAAAPALLALRRRKNR